jgi:hypothetical protein
VALLAVEMAGDLLRDGGRTARRQRRRTAAVEMAGDLFGAPREAPVRSPLCLNSSTSSS